MPKPSNFLALGYLFNTRILKPSNTGLKIDANLMEDGGRGLHFCVSLEEGADITLQLLPAGGKGSHSDWLGAIVHRGKKICVQIIDLKRGMVSNARITVGHEFVAQPYGSGTLFSFNSFGRRRVYAPIDFSLVLGLFAELYLLTKAEGVEAFELKAPESFGDSNIEPETYFTWSRLIKEDVYAHGEWVDFKRN